MWITLFATCKSWQKLSTQVHSVAKRFEVGVVNDFISGDCNCWRNIIVYRKLINVEKYHHASRSM